MPWWFWATEGEEKAEDPKREKKTSVEKCVNYFDFRMKWMMSVDPKICTQPPFRRVIRFDGFGDMGLVW